MRKKLSLFISLLLAALICGISWLNVFEVRNLLFRAATDNAMETTEQMGRTIDAVLDKQQSLLQALALMWKEEPDLVLDMMKDPERRAAFFNEESLRSVMLFEHDGSVIRMTEPMAPARLEFIRQTVFSHPLFWERMTKGLPALSFTEAVDGIPSTIDLYMPLPGEDGIHRFFRMALDKERLFARHIRENRSAEHSSHLLFRRDDVLAGKKDDPLVHEFFQAITPFTETATSGGDDAMRDIQADLRENRAGSLFRVVDGERYCASYLPLRTNPNWYFFSSVNGELGIYVDQALFYTILFSSSVGICAIIALFLFHRAARSHEAHIFRLAYTDELTGLHNKYYFEEFLLAHIQSVESTQGVPLAFILFDIAKFKLVNELFGYKTGNNILRLIAKGTRELLEPGELLARFGNDQFALVLPAPDEQSLRARLDSLFEKLRNDIKCGDFAIQLDFACGVCPITGENDVEELFSHANLACRQGKISQHESHVHFFRPDMLKTIEEEKRLEDRMYDALRDGEFQCYLQPKVDTRTETVIGAEALVRWVHPTRGLISPALFIPLFERNGFVREVDYAMFEQVCRLKKSWRERGLPDFVVSVNMSRRHFERTDFIERLTTIADAYGTNHATLELEVLESSVMPEDDAFCSMLKQLREAGFKIAMDDFGTGYSSLSLLRKVPLDMIKLDRSFLEQDQLTERGAKIVRNIVHLIRDIHAEAICEGVETAEQCRFLREVGCYFIQGYFYSRPLDVAAFEEFALNMNACAFPRKEEAPDI